MILAMGYGETLVLTHKSIINRTQHRFFIPLFSETWKLIFCAVFSEHKECVLRSDSGDTPKMTAELRRRCKYDPKAPGFDEPMDLLQDPCRHFS